MGKVCLQFLQENIQQIHVTKFKADFSLGRIEIHKNMGKSCP